MNAVFRAVSTDVIRAFIKWEVYHELGRGWSYLFSLFEYAFVGWLVVLLSNELSQGYVRILVPGIASAIVLRPFLLIGTKFCKSGTIPRGFFSSPIPAFLFTFRGITSDVLKMTIGIVVYFVVLAWASVPVSFAGYTFFWLLLLASIPLAVAYGFLMTSIQLLTRSKNGVRRLSELMLLTVGGVFFQPEVFPWGLGMLGYLTPHFYSIQMARGTLDLGGLTAWLSVLVIGAIFLYVGTVLLVRTLGNLLEKGDFHRVS